MPRALVFSDIHSDAKALERLMDIEADYYFAAGDVNQYRYIGNALTQPDAANPN